MHTPFLRNNTIVAVVVAVASMVSTATSLETGYSLCILIMLLLSVAISKRGSAIWRSFASHFMQLTFARSEIGFRLRFY